MKVDFKYPLVYLLLLETLSTTTLSNMATGDDVVRKPKADDSDDLSAIEEKLCGEWKLTKSENLDEYLKLMGFNFLLRKVASAAGCTLVISREGDKIRIITKGPKSSDHAFNLNTEVDSSDPQDNAMRATVTWEDGKLQTVSEPTANSKAKATKVCREVVTQDGKQQLIMTVTSGEVMMKRYFDRVK